MEWGSCYFSRQKDDNRTSDRSAFQRDFDRLIFSSAFRRLQNKTQVFPLPGTAFVHNRLTHSLEVASVGRSLGTIVGREIANGLSEQSHKDFYTYQLANVISAACLAHDVGNPAFGHSGEDAISNYFKEFSDVPIEGTKLKSFYEEVEWSDLINFEGNANAFRVLTQAFKGKSPKGMGLTDASLVAILKYPCGSDGVDRSQKHTKKYGFFQSEKERFEKLAASLELKQQSESPLVYKRHPFVYLVEAADDICYNIIDMEDAHRLGILSKEMVASAFYNVIEDLNNESDDLSNIQKTADSIGDDNESISYLRSKCINSLVQSCAKEFIDRQADILDSSYDATLFSQLEKQSSAVRNIEEISLERIYRHQSVLEIEIAGFNIMSGLLQMYVPAVLKEFKSPVDKTIIRLIPSQFSPDENMSPYLRTMAVLDHISSMTDAYAVEHYRKLTGIQISHRI